MEAVLLLLLTLFFLSYIVIGACGAIYLRWTTRSEGVDLLLDIVLWPLLVYYAWRGDA